MQQTTLDILLAQTGGRLTIKLDEACALFDGTTAKSYRNKKSLGRQPFPSYGHPLHVDLRDLADAIDARRSGAKNAPKITPPPLKKRGRPRNISRARTGGKSGMHSTTAAFHEAGHAVAAIVLGLRFDSVFVLGDSGRIDPLWVDGLPARWPDDDLATAIFTAAGPVAEARRCRRGLFNVFCDAGESDYNYLVGHDVGAVVAAARQILREHWRAVESVARALQERGILKESEVVLLVSASRKEGAQ